MSEVEYLRQQLALVQAERDKLAVKLWEIAQIPDRGKRSVAASEFAKGEYAQDFSAAVLNYAAKEMADDLRARFNVQMEKEEVRDMLAREVDPLIVPGVANVPDVGRAEIVRFCIPEMHFYVTVRKLGD